MADYSNCIHTSQWGVWPTKSCVLARTPNGICSEWQLLWFWRATNTMPKKNRAGTNSWLSGAKQETKKWPFSKWQHLQQHSFITFNGLPNSSQLCHLAPAIALDKMAKQEIQTWILPECSCLCNEMSLRISPQRRLERSVIGNVKYPERKVL